MTNRTSEQFSSIFTIPVNFGSLFGPRPQNNNNNNNNNNGRINLGDLANGFFNRLPKPKVTDRQKASNENEKR